MDKSNIIISIIIVLCVAAAVAAYGITNSESPIFTGLSSMSSSDTAGNGLGNNTTLGNGTGASVVNDGTGDGSGSGDSSGSGTSDGTGDGSGSGSSSSGSSSSGSSSSSDSGSGSSSEPSVSASAIKSDAWSHIGVDGYYPGTPYYSGSYWYVTIYDGNGSAVDSLQYSSSGAFLGRG